MKLTQINVFPVKSFQGLSLASGFIDDFGLQHDRRWMLVDVSGKFVTQRKHPKLSLLNVDLSSAGDVFIILDGERNLLSADVGNEVYVQVWSDNCVGWASADLSLDGKLSDYLGEAVRLVYMPPSTFRQVDTSYFPGIQRVSFADGFPLLLLSEASLSDLNMRLESKQEACVPMSRFRGNLEISGDIPYGEDNWQKLAIGEVEFAVVKPCSRCVMTTVDAATGTKGREPLKTLSEYRKTTGGVMFGQNIIQLNQGVISIGDVVQRIE